MAEVFGATDLADNLSQMFSSWKMVFTWILLPFVILTPDIVLKLNQKLFNPTPSDKVLLKLKNESLNPKELRNIGSKKTQIDINLYDKQ